MGTILRQKCYAQRLAWVETLLINRKEIVVEAGVVTKVHPDLIHMLGWPIHRLVAEGLVPPTL